MSRKYFGTDGVRGEVGQAPITPDFVMRLGYAAGTTLVAREHLPPGEHPAVLIGKDTRISGYMLEAALEAGFAAAGVDVCLVGPMPTPAVAYLTRALRLQAGVVISASHNPYHDNGIKFFSAQGTKLPDAVEMEIERRLDQPMGCMASAQLGKARRIDDAAGRYIEFCKSTFPSELDLRGLKIAVDSAHGAAYHIAPSVFHELGAEVFKVGVSPNGLNINDGVGATVPESLRRAMLESGADLGISLDGDGDRLIMADAQGRIYDGDQLLYVIARRRATQSDVPGVVGTLMSNLGFEHALARLSIPFIRARVGDRYVLELMQEKGWLLGGENSGHIICLDKHSTGDGIVSALQVLAALRGAGETLDQACADLAMYPQKLVNVPLPAGFDWQSCGEIQAARRVAEQVLDGRGRVLLRPSGTEPLLRVMVEGRDAELVCAQAEIIADAVRRTTVG
ncbi:phosphoglucosamine mutase [Denitratisoma oestradiolicum]|uniref:Phosphoglucosamine mutase n=1 Tax=Denitratisoma oestradiolicum TaxID=311182 RepID=A0A6S6XX10_9PROT|nr:phosphoglucosamine mutase [Denitratisoma oestradiolicum]TWO79802.1 phosphoglucosamine mutase [Denitratisoma oestradiolicum]CAB1369494.1 phosphoglucosamine mutase [Denitratisoma oestradiolicum]